MNPLLRDYDLFIFDWDGTLSTSTMLVRISHFFKRRYNPDYIRAHADKYSQPSRANMRFRSSEAHAVDFLYEIYSLFTRPKLRSGSIELLDALRKSNKRIALFSDGAQHRVHSEVRRLGLEKYFEVILSAETIHAYKPNPTGITLIAHELGTKKSRCLYVGDMSIDIFTARFAGIDVCSVGNGLDPYPTLVATKPDYLFESTEALARKIEGKRR
ncbi:MAG: HAD-IA family hydrolase [Candidatus Micrarchaeota archaeon]|nr:HAD-IA family hydrolase [Candidatus Micrarchaeota archaeon]